MKKVDAGVLPAASGSSPGEEFAHQYIVTKSASNRHKPRKTQITLLVHMLCKKIVEKA